MENRKPAILIVTELYPNRSVLFLGSFVKNQLKALENYYRFVVVVPVAFESKIERPVVTEGDISVHYIKSYFSFFLLGAGKFILNRRYEAKSWKKSFLRGRIIAIAKKLHSQYHFSAVHGHEVYVGDEAAAVGKALGIPSVVTIHNLYEYHESCFGAEAMKQVMENLNHAGKLIAVSEMTARSYAAKGIKEKIEVIPNGIGDVRAGLVPERWGRVIKDKTVILTVGFFGHVKRIEQVIYAAAELKKKRGDSFVVLIIGTGALEGFYRDIIKNVRMENQIHIVGQVPPAEMGSYFAAADFLVHPCVIESFSMVCLEAMAAGKPFICTKNIGITESVTDGKEAFVVPPDNIGSLIEKMDILLSDPELREKMGRAAKEAAKKFRWENQIGKILKIYSSLADNRGK
jgi:glycosyltransferase involved in cell wall biosynthesis